MRWPWPKKPSVEKPSAELVWSSQYRSRGPGRVGVSLIHFAKTEYGTFEIYDEANDVFLVSYPPSLGLPAEVFETPGAAKARCNEVIKEKKGK